MRARVETTGVRPQARFGGGSGRVEVGRRSGPPSMPRAWRATTPESAFQIRTPHSPDRTRVPRPRRRAVSAMCTALQDLAGVGRVGAPDLLCCQRSSCRRSNEGCRSKPSVEHAVGWRPPQPASGRAVDKSLDFDKLNQRMCGSINGCAAQSADVRLNERCVGRLSRAREGACRNHRCVRGFDFDKLNRRGLSRVGASAREAPCALDSALPR